jgi:hypothetical protein
MSELEHLLEELERSPNLHDRELARQYPLKRIRQIQKEEIAAFKASLDQKWINWLGSMRK